MKVKYEREADVLLIRLKDAAIADSDEVQPGIILDYAEDGSVVCIEILNASQKMAQVNKLEFETT